MEKNFFYSYESTRIAEFIITGQRKGKGTEENPVRFLDQIWTKDGVKIAEYDPATGIGDYNPSGLGSLYTPETP